MLRDRLAEVENLLERSPFILARNLEYFITSSITAYIKGEVLFVDDSRLSLFEHFRRKDRKLEMTDYRYHYMAKDGPIISGMIIPLIILIWSTSHSISISRRVKSSPLICQVSRQFLRK